MTSSKPSDSSGVIKPLSITPENAKTLFYGDNSSRNLPMRVIVCGLGRTGTASTQRVYHPYAFLLVWHGFEQSLTQETLIAMQTALGMLGIPAYHSFNLWQDSLEHIELWDRVYNAKYNGKGNMLSRNEFDEILGDYMAVVDVPGAFVGPELAALYPDAKVIILNREPEAWFRSCQATFTMRANWLNWVFKRILTVWDDRVQGLASHLELKQKDVWRFEWHDADAREKALKWFHEYYAECRERIPADRRIEFQVTDGWEPLCDFLQMEVPSIVIDGQRKELPFPKTNDSAAFEQRRKKFSHGIIRKAMSDWVLHLGYYAAIAQALYISRNSWMPFVLRVFRTSANLLRGVSVRS